MKNSIKKSLSLVALIIALVVSSSVMAQPQGNGQQRGPSVPNAKQITKMVTDLSKELSLNKDQETTITKLYTTHFEEIKEATAKGRPDRTKMEALKTNFETKVKALLTEKQQKLFVEYQKKNGPGQRQGQGRQRPTK